MLLQHSVLSYQIGLYFPKHRLAMEFDEKGHTDWDEEKEIERQEAIKEALRCEFIRVNPDIKNFNIYVEIGKIYNHIIKSAKNYFIDKISK